MTDDPNYKPKAQTPIAAVKDLVIGIGSAIYMAGSAFVSLFTRKE